MNKRENYDENFMSCVQLILHRWFDELRSISIGQKIERENTANLLMKLTRECQSTQVAGRWSHLLGGSWNLLALAKFNSHVEERKIHWLFSSSHFESMKKKEEQKQQFYVLVCCRLERRSNSKPEWSHMKRAVCFQKRNEVWPWAFFEFSTLKIVYMCDLRECRRNQKFISHPPKSTWQIAVFSALVPTFSPYKEIFSSLWYSEKVLRPFILDILELWRILSILKVPHVCVLIEYEFEIA